MLRPLREGASHGLGGEVQRLCRAGAARLEVVTLEDVEHQLNADAAGTWRRHADDVVAPIRTANGRSLLRLVVLEILTSNQAAVRLHLFFDELGGFALVKACRSVVRNALERSREIGLFEQLAGGVRLSVFRKLRERAGILLEFRKRPFQRACE